LTLPILGKFDGLFENNVKLAVLGKDLRCSNCSSWSSSNSRSWRLGAWCPAENYHVNIGQLIGLR
jgi:hypothetical protein